MEEADESQRQKGHRKAKLESGIKRTNAEKAKKKKMNSDKKDEYKKGERERHGESMNECMRSFERSTNTKHGQYIELYNRSSKKM